MGLVHVPTLIHWRSNCRPGMHPNAWHHRRVVDGLNHVTAYRSKREVYRKAWEIGGSMGNTASTTAASRFRIRTSYGTDRLSVWAMIATTIDRGAAQDPVVDLVIGGVGTLNLAHYGVQVGTPPDGPDDYLTVAADIAVSGATAYECTINLIDYARIVAIVVYESAPLTLTESTNYYSTHQPTGGSPIYDQQRSQVLVGLSNHYITAGGAHYHWSKWNGAAATRTLATLANLVDGATTGNPSASTQGIYLDGSNRNTANRTTFRVYFGVYAETAAGSAGIVRLVDTSGTNHISITNISTSAAWYTATGTIPASATKLDLMFAGDGVNQVSVFGASVIETG